MPTLSHCQIIICKLLKEKKSLNVSEVLDLSGGGCLYFTDVSMVSIILTFIMNEVITHYLVIVIVFKSLMLK